MKITNRVIAVAVSFSLIGLSDNAFCQQTSESVSEDGHASLVADGAIPRLISRQFSFTEGPAVDKNGNVFFTDQPNNKIWKYSNDGKLSVFLENAGRSNGMYFNKKGNLITCADEQNQIWSIDKKGKATVLLNDHEGKKLNGPNDLWIHPNGDIYFTDPYYQRKYWTRTKPEIEGKKVYHLANSTTVAVPVIDDLEQPNGIVGSPDGRSLYVADIGARKTYVYSIKEDGSLGEGQLFTKMGSDGMTIDNQGNIYITGKGVTVFNSDGKQIAHINIPEKWTANVIFSGKKLDKLFITASEAVYVLDMKVKGVK